MFICSVCGYEKTEVIPKINAYTVNLYGYDGKLIKTEYALPEEDLSINYVPECKGYDFVGWKYKNSEQILKFPIEINGDISLYSEWVPTVYYASFYADSTLVATKPFTIEDCEIVNPAVPEKIGYTGVWEGYSIIADNIIINVIYTPIIYTISYILEGGINSKNNPFNYTIESETIVFEPANKEGYDFIEWDIKKIEKGSYGDKKIRASYSLAIYNINYILDGGINSIKNPSTYTILDTLTFGDASKTGYSFGGWFTDAELVNGIEVINENYGELSLYAKFIPLEFTATFISEEFVEYNVYLFYWEDSIYNRTLTYKNGDTFDIYSFEIPSRNKYFFGGWFLEPEFVNPLEKEYYVYRSITVYAKWYEKEKIVGYSSSAIELTRNISLSASSSDGVDSYSRDFYVSSTYDCNIIIQYYVYADCSIASLSASQGYVSLYDATDSEYVFSISTIKGSSSSETSVMLKWGHYYHIYCYARGKKSTSHYGVGPYTAPASARIKIIGVARSSQNSIVSNIVPEQYDSQMVFPAPCREGYDFVGWYDENDNLITDVWNYTSDKEFHAVWSIHNYSIEYVLNGVVNNASNPTSYNLNDTIELSNPTRDGYDFTGWYSDSAFKNNITVIDGNVCKDYVLYAKWTPKTYTATLNYDGGQNCPTINFYSDEQIIKSQDLYKDSTIEYFIPTAPSSNLIFGGWYLDQAFTEQFSFDGIINRDLTVYAKWIEVSDAEYSDLGNDVSVSINGNTYTYIAVVPLIDQSVTVTSLSEFDLYGAIYDANRNLITFCDDISDENLNFAITMNMQAGQVYYIGYKANQAFVMGDATISITGSNVVSTHVMGDSEIIETISATYDAEFSLPMPKKEGYHFVGWYDENNEVVDPSLWNYTESVNFHAVWE